ncbi:hypothetical protein X801_03135, partial [Opisthorchis viverrini]
MRGAAQQNCAAFNADCSHTPCCENYKCIENKCKRTKALKYPGHKMYKGDEADSPLKWKSVDIMKENSRIRSNIAMAVTYIKTTNTDTSKLSDTTNRVRVQLPVKSDLIAKNQSCKNRFNDHRSSKNVFKANKNKFYVVGVSERYHESLNRITVSSRASTDLGGRYMCTPLWQHPTMSKLLTSFMLAKTARYSLLYCTAQARTLSAISMSRTSAFPSFNSFKRWKSKNKGKPNESQPSRDQIPSDLLDFINEAEMMQEFEGTLSRFQMALQQRMALKLTPQLLADLPLPEAHTKLGQVANLIVQQNTKSGTSQGGQSSVGDQTLLIDLAGRPELTTAARKAVTQFLESTRGGGTQLQSAGPSAFTVRLRTVITREAREELIHRGHELLNQVKREMDRIYQKHDKLILGNSEGKKRFSEDYLFLTREYLRHLVKRQHALATSIWEQKEHELRSG